MLYTDSPKKSNINNTFWPSFFSYLWYLSDCKRESGMQFNSDESISAVNATNSTSFPFHMRKIYMLFHHSSIISHLFSLFFCKFEEKKIYSGRTWKRKPPRVWWVPIRHHPAHSTKFVVSTTKTTTKTKRREVCQTNQSSWAAQERAIRRWL